MKRLLLLIIALMMMLTSTTYPVFAAQCDVNGDGKMLTSDYILLKRYVAGAFDGDINGDLDENGKIEEADITIIKETMGWKTEDVTDDSSATIYQLYSSNDALMMSYLVVTENGHLIMIDGGMSGEGCNYNTLYNNLKRYGNLKDRDNVVDAWIFTHPHNDHVKAFCYVWKQHPEIKVSDFYFNFPTEDEILAMAKEEHQYTEDLKFFTDTFNENMGSDTAYEEYPKTEAGDSFVIDGVKFEILQTYDSTDSLPKNVDDCSMVVRMTAGGQSVLFLGDLRESGQALLDTYGNELKSDIVQMSRHGQNGVEREVYEVISPQVCLWPTPLWVWESNTSTEEIRGWMDELGVKYHNLAKTGWLDKNYNSLKLSDNSIAIPCEYVVK